MKSINREAPSLIWTHCKHKQVHSKEEKDKFTGEEEEAAAEDILSLGFLSPFDIVLSDMEWCKRFVMESQTNLMTKSPLLV